MHTRTDARITNIVRDKANELGLSQAALANSAGMHPLALSRRMTGAAQWKADDICRVCLALGINLLDLPELVDDRAEGEVPA